MHDSLIIVRLFNYAVVQLAPIMINRIAWRTYFVFFCFNLCFIPIVSISLSLHNLTKLNYKRFTSSFLSPTATNSRYLTPSSMKHTRRVRIQSSQKSAGGSMVGARLQKHKRRARTVRFQAWRTRRIDSGV